MPAKRTVFAVLVLGGLLMMSGACSKGPSTTLPAGDVTIFTGPRFWTGDPQRPWADGVAVQNGSIVALLDNSDVAQHASSGVEIRRLQGRLATAGLVDAHAHLYGYGKLAQECDLTGTASREDVLEAVKAWAGEHPDEPWVVGRGWDQNDWPETAWPTADQLEKAVPGRPVALSRVDGHALWVNRTALERAGIDDDTPDPAGGRILRGKRGHATGMLIDEAAELVWAVVPEPTEESIATALESAAQDLMAVGLTGIHEMGMEQRVWDVLVRLVDDRRFPLRIHAYAMAGDPLAARLMAQGEIHHGNVHLIGVKQLGDGALGSRGARLLEPYSDEPDTRGVWVTSPEQMKKTARQTVEAGLQPAIHAIGDAANRAVLDVYADVYAGRDAPARPPRLEHTQIVSPEDLSRVSELGVVASMQPTHCTSDMPWVDERLGEERLEGAYAWKTLLDDGAILAFGSDFPVESIDPRLGLYAAITRADLEGNPEGGWRPAEKLSPEEALAAFTSGAAAAIGESERLGRIVVGARCDITVFDRNWLESPDPFTVIEARVESVVIDGEVHSIGNQP